MTNKEVLALVADGLNEIMGEVPVDISASAMEGFISLLNRHLMPTGLALFEVNNHIVASEDW